MTRGRLAFLGVSLLALVVPMAAWANTGTDGTYTFIDSREAAGATTPVFNYTPLVGATAVALGDEAVSAPIPIGFNFTYYGAICDRIQISSNGFIYMLRVADGPQAGAFCGDQLTELGTPTIDPDGSIFACWADLDPGSGGTISTLQCGVAPNRWLAVEYEGVPQFANPALPIRVQVWLFEGSNEILMQLSDVTVDTSTGCETAQLTQIENFDGSLRLFHFGFTGTGSAIPGVLPRMACRYTTAPASNSSSVPPGRIGDLAAGAPITDGSVFLTWTATGADATTGTASSYDIRWSTAAITDANFSAANQLTGEPAPAAFGTPQSFNATGLPCNTLIFFAIVAIDNYGRAGCVSNSPSATTLLEAPAVPPNTVADLTITATTATTMTIQWTAPGDDGAVGTAMSYDVRISTTGPINDGNFAAATPVTGEPTPSPAGTLETMTIINLTPFTRYWVALRATDNCLNTSLTSNSPNATTSAPSWEPGIPGSDTGGGISNTAAYSMDPCLDVNPTTNQPGVTWTDRDTTGLDLEIFMRESNGTAFAELAGSASGGGLSNNTTQSQFPDIVYDASGRPVIAWQDAESVAPGDTDIFVRRFNAGAWQELAGSASGDGISANDSSSSRPSIDINPTINAPVGEPGVAWSDFSVGDFEIFFREFTGAAWVERALSGTGQGVSNNTGVSIQPSLAYDALGRPVIAWSDNSGGNFEIYVRRFNGVAWEELAGSGTGGGISQTALTSQNPSVAIGSGNNPVVVWQENLADGNVEIYGRRFDGVAWVDFGPASATNGGISVTPGRSVTPELCAHPAFIDVFLLVWVDFSFTAGASEIYGKWFDNGQWREIGTFSARLGGISNTAGQSISPCCGISNAATPVIYVCWQEFSGTNYEIFVRRLLLFGVVSDSNEEFVVGGGRGGRGEYRVFDNGTTVPPYTPLELRVVPFSAAYNADPGELHPACGDTDGDGNDETVLGQGSFPGGNGGFVAVMRDHSGVFSQVRQLRFPWSAYFNANGAVYPALGDFDGDGRDEIAMGMGTFAPGGYVALFDDETTGFRFLRFIRLTDSAYNFSNGTVHAAMGDVDGDGVDEFVLGVGTGGGGQVQIMDDLLRGATSLATVRYPIPSYNTREGSTWPACGNLTGGLGEEIVVGPGRGGFGLLYIYGDRAQSFARVGGMQIPSPPYNSFSGEGHPAVGNLDPDRPLEVAVGFGDFPGNVLFAGQATPSNVYVFDNVTTGSAAGRGVQYVNSNPAFNTQGRPTFPATGQLR